MPQTLTMFEKIWGSHVIETFDDGNVLLWIDRHIINEGTSIQAFAELQERNIPVARPAMHLTVADHVVPTLGRAAPLPDGVIEQVMVSPLVLGEVVKQLQASNAVQEPERSRLVASL